MFLAKQAGKHRGPTRKKGKKALKEIFEAHDVLGKVWPEGQSLRLNVSSRRGWARPQTLVMDDRDERERMQGFDDNIAVAFPSSRRWCSNS